MGLKQYRKKRDFSKTPEPQGKVEKAQQQLYVIQKHAASHLHYDFRLEVDGVLKSWAVPKGPSLDPHSKRLAMQVEDHPLEYGSFEGIIPKGQYGGGTVMLWDRGTWEPLDTNVKAALRKGHLRFELHGEKLQGRWDLIRFKDEKHWFLIKYDDEYARTDYEITEDLTQSVLTHKNIKELSQHYDKVWRSDSANEPTLLLPEGLKKSAYPPYFSPELATLVDKPPTNPGWLYEVKFDGYRILAFKKGKKVSLKSRNNIDWTDALSSVAQAIAQLPYTNLILDGEVVVLDKQGHSDFQLLQNSIKAKEPAAFVYFVFDLLYFEQYDLKSLSLIDRKTVLQSLIPKDMPILHFSDHLLEGDDLYQFACKEGLEGVIAKKIDSLYYSKRTKEWLKIKCLKRQEFVVGGYTAPKGNREYFGSLLLGVYNDKNELVYSGNVGTGFNQASLSEIYDQLIANKRTKNPFNTTPADYRHAQWVKPTLVVEVEFTEWTEDGHLRHPSFKGLRLDKKATDVIRETTTPLEKVKPTMKKSPTNKQQLVLSNPQKILYPEDQYTKQDLWDYYEIVSEHILPFLSMRPLTLLRCPEGYNHCFYQRHYNDNTNPALHSIAVKNTDNTEEQYIYLDDTLGLLSLVQMGVLEIHPWGSQKQDLEKPDMIVIDLDPGPDVPWTQVVAAAYEVREHLMQYQLQSFVKSTGGKGLHVVIPIKPEYDWDAVKQFTQVFVQFLEKLKPKEYTSNMSKAKRKGKIYVDYLRNQRTATAIAAYSTRARIHAPVSTPLFWDELSDSIEDNTYTIKTLPQRLKKLKADPWQDFWKIKQSLRLDDLE